MGALEVDNAMPTPDPVYAATPLVWKGDEAASGARMLPEETAVALVYDGSTEAVMMATPADLEDFAYGFSLTEGLIRDVAEVSDLQIVASDLGVEARIWLTADRSREVTLRRRSRAGPTGCGLCGIESLEEAGRLRTLKASACDLSLSAPQVRAAMASLEGGQPFGQLTRAVHAAGFWTPDRGLVALREDVGRHNALDKLAGALARQGVDASTGAVLLTSRVSVEMVQKTVAIGASVLVAISAPTALAVRTAEAAGVTLVAVARSDGFEVFSHPDRIRF